MGKPYGYFDDLQQNGWKAGGILFVAHNDVKPIESHFNLQVWKACQIVTDHLIHLDDFAEAKLVLDLLTLMRDNDYSLTVPSNEHNDMVIHRMRKALRSLLPHVISYDDCMTIRSFDDMLWQIARLGKSSMPCQSRCPRR